MLVEFALSGVSVMIVSAFMPGMRVRSFLDAVFFSVVVAILNVLAWQVFGIFNLPLKWLTLGLWGFFVNGFIFLGAQKVARGVEISGCLVASIAAVLVSLVNTAVHHLVR